MGIGAVAYSFPILIHSQSSFQFHHTGEEVVSYHFITFPLEVLLHSFILSNAYTTTQFPTLFWLSRSQEQLYPTLRILLCWLLESMSFLYRCLLYHKRLIPWFQAPIPSKSSELKYYSPSPSFYFFLHSRLLIPFLSYPHHLQHRH